MHVVTMARLLGDDELQDRMSALAEWGMAINSVPGTADSPPRLELIDSDGVAVLSCVVRLDPLAQLDELLTIYLDAILCPDATRH